MSSYPEKDRAQIAEMRRQHPGWGPKTIHAELCIAGAEKHLPGPASID